MKPSQITSQFIHYLMQTHQNIHSYSDLFQVIVKFGLETGISRVLSWSITRAGLGAAAFPLDCVMGISGICHIAGEKFENELLKKMGYPAKGLNWASDQISNSLIRHCSFLKGK